jgi:hypothetical protein
MFQKARRWPNATSLNESWDFYRMPYANSVWDCILPSYGYLARYGWAKLFSWGKIAAGFNNQSYYMYGSSSGFIFKSTDSGSNWNLILSHGCFGAETHPSNASIIYAFNPSREGVNDPDDGIWVSQNWGSSWNQRGPNEGVSNLQLKCLSVLKGDQTGGTAYAGCYKTGEDSDAILKTTNAGQSWTALGASGLPDYLNIGGIATDDNASSMYVYQALTNISDLIYRTTNGGTSWSIIAHRSNFTNLDIPFAAITSIALDPSDENKLFILISGFLVNDYVTYLCYTYNALESNPDDVSWSVVPYSVSQVGVPSSIGGKLAINSAGVVYCAVYGAFALSWDQMTSYLQQLPPPPNTPIADPFAQSITIRPANEEYIYIGTSTGLYISTDYGESFNSTIGPLKDNCTAMNADLPNIYTQNFTGSDGSISKSGDYGLNWHAVYARSGIQGIILSDYTNSLGIGIKRDRESGVMASIWTCDPYYWHALALSNDYGENWYENHNPAPPSDYYDYFLSIAFDNSSVDERVYLGIGSRIGGTSNNVPRVGVSFNNGGGWSYYTISQNNVSIKDVATGYGPNWSDYVIVADSFNFAYVSSDQGVTWNNVEDVDTPDRAYRIAVSDEAQTEYVCPIYVGSTNGVWRNISAFLQGTSWDNRSYGITSGYNDVTEIILRPGQNEVLYCAAHDANNNYKVFISADSARSWNQLSTGFHQNFRLNDFDIDPAYPDTCYAATDSGTYKIYDNVKSGTIASSSSWGPGFIIVNGDVTIPSGVTLTIAPGTDVKFVYDFDKLSTGSDPYKSELIVKGTLDCDDAGNQANPVVFESSEPYSQKAGHWYAIRADSASSVSMAYCVVKHSVYGVKAYKPSTFYVDHCDIEQNTTSGIYAQYLPSNAHIRYSRILNSGTYGIYNLLGSTLISYDTLTNNRYGVWAYGGSPTIDHCKITFTSTPNNSYSGIETGSQQSFGFYHA